MAVRLVLPEAPDVRSWLSRMDLGAVVEAFGVRVEGAFREPPSATGDTLIELQRFDDAHGSDRLASFIWDRHPGVPAASIRRHDRRRGRPVGDPVARLPHPGRGPRPKGLPGLSRASAGSTASNDGLVKAVLVDRGGERLILKGAPERTGELARRAAQNRGVVDRLETG